MSDDPWKQDGDGDCFLVAAHLTFMFDGVLAHGIVTGQGKIEGIRFGHAWVELDDAWCVDHSNGLQAMMRKDKYYALGKITDVRYYTSSEAAQMIREHEHFGPWETDDE